MSLTWAFGQPSEADWNKAEWSTLGALSPEKLAIYRTNEWASRSLSGAHICSLSDCSSNNAHIKWVFIYKYQNASATCISRAIKATKWKYSILLLYFKMTSTSWCVMFTGSAKNVGSLTSRDSRDYGRKREHWGKCRKPAILNSFFLSRVGLTPSSLRIPLSHLQTSCFCYDLLAILQAYKSVSCLRLCAVIIEDYMFSTCAWCDVKGTKVEIQPRERTVEADTRRRETRAKL